MGDIDINFHLACTSYTLILHTYIWTSNTIRPTSSQMLTFNF